MITRLVDNNISIFICFYTKCGSLVKPIIGYVWLCCGSSPAVNGKYCATSVKSMKLGTIGYYTNLEKLMGFPELKTVSSMAADH